MNNLSQTVFHKAYHVSPNSTTLLSKFLGVWGLLNRQQWAGPDKVFLLV